MDKASSRIKCGEIFLQETNNYQIVYTCMFCSEELEKADHFVKHIQHHVRPNESSSTMECTEESESKNFWQFQTDSRAINENDELIDFTVDYLYEEELAAGDESIKQTIFSPRKTEDSKFDENDVIYDDSNDENLSDDVKGKPINSLEIELLSVEMESTKNTDALLDDDVQNSIEDCKDTNLKPRIKSTCRIGQEKKQYECEFCDITFKDISNLRVHRFRHLGIKPHSCKLCEKRFTSSTELKLHLRSHTGERPYVCQDCGRCFSNSAHLTAHRRRHFNDRPHACPSCGKRFFDKKSMRDHEVSHSNDRPFICEYCESTFSRHKALMEHKKLHSDTKNYLCKICGKTFAQNAGLHSHMKRHVYSACDKN